MSYILDALKKSERERALESISTLSPVTPTQMRPETQWPRWWFGFCVLVLIGVLIWRFQTPLQHMASDFLRDAKSIVSNINLPDFLGKQQEIEEESKKVTELPSKVIEEIEPDEPNQVQQSVAPTVKEKAVTSSIEVEESKIESKPTVASIEGDNKTESQAAAQSSNIEALEPEKKPEILSLNLAPVAVRQKLSALTLSVISYTKDEERRFVLVNDQMFREGDGLPGGVIIEKITRDGIIVADNDVKVLLRP